MPISEQRRKDLSDLAEVLQPLFPQNAQFIRHVESGSNFVISWRIPDQPQHLTQFAREISIRFAERALRQYAELDDDGKMVAHKIMSDTVAVALQDYTTNIWLPRGSAQTPHIIEIQMGTASARTTEGRARVTAE